MFASLDDAQKLMGSHFSNDGIVRTTAPAKRYSNKLVIDLDGKLTEYKVHGIKEHESFPGNPLKDIDQLTIWLNQSGDAVAFAEFFPDPPFGTETQHNYSFRAVDSLDNIIFEKCFALLPSRVLKKAREIAIKTFNQGIRHLEIINDFGQVEFKIDDIRDFIPLCPLPGRNPKHNDLCYSSYDDQGNMQVMSIKTGQRLYHPDDEATSKFHYDEFIKVVRHLNKVDRRRCDVQFILPDDDKKIFTTQDAANFLHIPEEEIKKLVYQGKVKAGRSGDEYFIFSHDIKQIEDLIESSEPDDDSFMSM